MKTGMLKPVALVTSISILVSGCAELTPGENAAAFGGGAALLAGGIASAAGLGGTESFLIGAATGAVVAATVYVIAKHQATERQRRVAEQRARVYYGRVISQRKRQQYAAKKAGKKVAGPGTPRYIAVDTERSAQAPPNARKSVMIWDTQSEQIVGNNVYDVQSTPSVGKTAKFETYSAEYVGSGS